MGPIVFHITERTAFQHALEVGVYEHETLASQGFIHCSHKHQLLSTAARFFHGREGLVLLVIDAERAAPALREEPADGESFPHHYGPIALDRIVAVVDFPPRADGAFDLPEELDALG